MGNLMHMVFALLGGVILGLFAESVASGVFHAGHRAQQGIASGFALLGIAMYLCIANAIIKERS